MPVKLNLLPQGLLVSKSLSGVLKTVRSLNVIFSAAFLVFAIGIGAFFVMSKLTLGNLNKKVDLLKTEVLALESSEQRLILLKDRLAKITLIQSVPSILNNVDNVSSYLSDLSDYSSINEMDVESKQTDLSMSIKSNDDLIKFIEKIESTDLYGSVVLSSFNYSTEGYNVGVSFTEK